jgi:TRAP-type C4-dicarboxylate transport system permease small subunit
MGWFDEIIEMMVAWLIFTGAALLSRNQDHFRVDLIQMKLNGKRSLFILEIIINIATALFFIALLYYSLNLVIGAVQTTPVLRLQKRWFYICIPFSSFIITIYTIKNIILNMHRFLTYKKEL